jgi:hypothetical protein
MIKLRAPGEIIFLELCFVCIMLPAMIESVVTLILLMI